MTVYLDPFVCWSRGISAGNQVSEGPSQRLAVNGLAALRRLFPVGAAGLLFLVSFVVSVGAVRVLVVVLVGLGLCRHRRRHGCCSSAGDWRVLATAATAERWDEFWDVGVQVVLLWGSAAATGRSNPGVGDNGPLGRVDFRSELEEKGGLFILLVHSLGNVVFTGNNSDVDEKDESLSQNKNPSNT